MRDKTPSFKWLLLMAAFSALLPIWITQREMWDGVYVEYAFKTLDMSGLLHGANASGWPIASWIYKIQLKLQESFYLPYAFVVDVIYTAALVGIACEVFIFTKKQLNLSHGICVSVVVLFLVQPIWHLFMSGVHVIHMVGFWFLLLGHRFSYGKSVWHLSFGWALITLSFQFPAAFFMIFWLELIHHLNAGKSNNKTYWRVLFVAAYTFGWYALSRTVFKPVEIYSGYNQVQFPTSIDAFQQVIWTSMKFSSWIIGLTAPLWVVALFRHGFHPKSMVEKLKASAIKGQRLLSPTGVAILGCLIAVVPYVIVGKGPVLVFPFEWTSRHALPLALPLSILVALLINQLCTATNPHQQQNQERMLLAAVATFWLLMGAVGLAGKLYQIKLEKAIEASLRNFPAPASGLVTLQLPFNPLIRIGPPEINGIFWRAYDRTEWAVMMGPPDSWVKKIREMYVGEGKNSLKKIQNRDLWYRFAVMGNLKSFDCETTLLLTLPQGEQGSAAWARWLGWSSFQFTVSLEKTTCP